MKHHGKSVANPYSVHIGSSFLKKIAKADKNAPSDDTGVAILEKHGACHQTDEFDVAPNTKFGAILHFNQKHTADNSKFRGIHPVQSMRSHQEHLAALIDSALPSLPNALPLSNAIEERSSKQFPIRCLKSGKWIWKRKPDFVSVTRGPGMISSLDVGLNTAKGLALAWQIPLLGVNHMQSHALTPRLVSALDQQNSHSASYPKFPFLSLLVSGGHTLLLYSKSIIDHAVLASTCDIAIGDALDKIARVVCPDVLLQSPGEIMYGRLLEQFAFPNGEVDHQYVPPATRGEELASNITQWGWNLPVPFAMTSSGAKTRLMKFSFTGLDSKVRKICTERGDIMVHEERLQLAREAMRVAFEHLASRVALALDALGSSRDVVDTLVVSGGVASNSYLKTMYVSPFALFSSFPLCAYWNYLISTYLPTYLYTYLPIHLSV